MTFSECCLSHLKEHPLRPLARLRLKMILQDADFAAALESKVRREMELPAGAIDWSEIDWVEVTKLVLMILAMFGVL